MNRFDPNPLWPAIGIVAAVAAPVGVTVAATYLTAEQAQKALFPDADAFAAVHIALTADQKRAIAAAAGAQPPHGELRAWAAKRGDAILGHVFVDNVIGREDFITYAVGIGADGKGPRSSPPAASRSRRRFCSAGSRPITSRRCGATARIARAGSGCSHSSPR